MSAPRMVVTQGISQIDNCLAEEGKSILAIDSPKYNSPTFLLIEKLTKDQADMNARPRALWANVSVKHCEIKHNRLFLTSSSSLSCYPYAIFFV